MEGFVVKALRMNLGLKQTEFANEIGVSQQAISAIENGNRPVTKRVANRIIYRFNIKQEEIDAIRKFKRWSDKEDLN
ncbi:helix-turn-helix transcriptional regulator [Bacillus infantis]|uniref:helix-turn-helix transcriptional regulator n=1 Tax=Bacillus infantis TaxID=324767 RepID=UPI003CE7A2C8